MRLVGPISVHGNAERPLPEGTSMAPRVHLRQLDLIRALTVVGVVAVHGTFFTNPEHSVGAGAAIMMLHYTREVFLFLTAFVLFYTYGERPIGLRRFWGKRFRVVLAPYVIWTLIYTYISMHPTWGEAPRFLRLVTLNLIEGKAWYHLYYLLITMQLYLLFPVAQWVIERTRGQHMFVWMASAILELVLMAWDQYGVPQGGVLSFRNLAFFTYQFYLISGAIAATHRVPIEEWLVGHKATVTAAWVFSGVAALGIYAFSYYGNGDSVTKACTVFQPAMVPYCLTTIAMLYQFGLKWARGNSPKVVRQALTSLSHHSFGIYLAHPLILYGILKAVSGPVGSWWPLLRTVAVVALTLTSTYASVALVSLTPISLVVLGRPRTRISFRVRWPARPLARRRVGNLGGSE